MARLIVVIISVILVNTALPVSAQLAQGEDLDISPSVVNAIVPRYDEVTNEAQWVTGVTIVNNTRETMYYGTSISHYPDHGFAILTNETLPPGAARNIPVYAEVDVLPNGSYNGSQYLLFRKESQPGWHVAWIMYSIEIRGEPPYCSIAWQSTYPERTC